MNQQKRIEIYTRLQAHNPAPRTELSYETPFELLIAVLLSAQATDISVNKATRTLYAEANTPDALLALGEDGIKRHIRHIGLFNSKAKHIVATCAMLIEQHNGEVPQERALLERLPGVGRKTANVVLNTAFGADTIAVDTHIFRVGNRTRIAAGKTPRAVEDRLDKFTPAQFKHDAHHWLILHGRYTCTARAPRCANCVISDLCDYPKKTPASGSSG